MASKGMSEKVKRQIEQCESCKYFYERKQFYKQKYSDTYNKLISARSHNYELMIQLTGQPQIENAELKAMIIELQNIINKQEKQKKNVKTL